MIHERETGQALRLALRGRRPVMLRGLPRIGRTTLLNVEFPSGEGISRFHSSTDFLAAITNRTEFFAAHEEWLVIVDHVLAVDVPEVVALLRAVEALPGAPKFLLAPQGCDAATELRRSYTVHDLELPSVQVEEFLTSFRARPVSDLAEPGLVDTIAQEAPLDQLWLRGGIPDFLDAREHNYRVYLDGLLRAGFPRCGIDGGHKLADVLAWAAEFHGQEFDDATAARGLRMSKDLLRTSLDHLEAMGLLRRLLNFPELTRESLSALPVWFVRDSGIWHALRGVGNISDLRSHRHAGAGWEGFAGEALIVAVEGHARAQFFRQQNSEKVFDEIDLVFTRQNGPTIAIEFKINPNEGPRPGFHRARKAIEADDAFVVHSGPTDNLRSDPPRLTLISAIERCRTQLKLG